MKKPKEVPEWDYDSELFRIVEQGIFNGRTYLKDFTTITLTKADGVYQAEAQVDQSKKEAYIKKYYGKKLICTDRAEWSTLEILDSYCDQECVEGLFRVSKDTDHFAIRPQYHWTDQKIKVHVFCCLTAITIAEVLRKKRRTGICPYEGCCAGQTTAGS